MLKSLIANKWRDLLKGKPLDVGRLPRGCGLSQQIVSQSDAGYDYLKGFTSKRYPFFDQHKVINAVSSGVCNLRCSYCITDRPTGNPSLTKEDFSFIFENFGENIYFIISGLGDFFCGYPMEEQLLRFLLKHNVTLYLNTNGVEIRELADSDLEGKEKIQMIDISYHYVAMKERNVLLKWASNIAAIQNGRYNFYLKMVASPGQMDMWEEAIGFYRKEIQPITGQRLTIMPDKLSLQKAALFSALLKLRDDYSDSVMIINRESTEVRQPLGDCPAGSRYFRVFNNGDIVPCEYFQYYTGIRLGNTKRKELVTFTRDVLCGFSDLCDCDWTTKPRAGLRDEYGRPYKRRILYKFTSERMDVQLPGPADNITYYIDILDNSGAELIIEGWAFPEGVGTEGIAICPVLNAEKETYVFSSLTIKRPDLTAHFNNSFVLDEAGFRAIIPKALLSIGVFRIGLFISGNGLTALRYTDSAVQITCDGQETADPRNVHQVVLW